MPIQLLTKPHAQKPIITGRQADILLLLYYFRFLNRIQIQSMLSHKSKGNVLPWLKDLRDKQFVEWIYDTSKDGRTKPAVYYLTTRGIRHLRSREDTTPLAIQRLYGSANRTPPFVARCLFIADIAIQVRDIDRDTSQFSYATPAAYLSDVNGPTVMSEASIRPDLLVRTEDRQAHTYFIEYIPVTLPNYMLRTKLREYIDFAGSHEWQPESPAPILLLIAESPTQTRAITNSVRQLLNQTEPLAQIIIKLATADQVASSDLFAPIWATI